MKRTILFFGLILALAAASLGGSQTFALGNASSTKSGAENYCSRFGTLSQKYEQNVAGQIGKLQSRIQAQIQKVQTNRKDLDDKLAQNRQKWTQNRDNLYARLNARAKTDAEKQAVATFKGAIEAAVAARENAVDAARNTYRQSADQLIDQHRSAVEQVLNSFQAAIQAAIGQAQASCTAGTAPAHVRTAFQQALEAARQARKAGVQEVDKIGPQMEALAQTRNAAIQQAMTTYQNALHAAIAALHQAFNEPAATPAATTTPSAT